MSFRCLLSILEGDNSAQLLECHEDEHNHRCIAFSTGQPLTFPDLQGREPVPGKGLGSWVTAETRSIILPFSKIIFYFPVSVPLFKKILFFFFFF